MDASESAKELLLVWSGMHERFRITNATTCVDGLLTVHVDRTPTAEPAGEGAASDEEFEKACEAIKAAYHWGDGAADAWGRLRTLWATHRRPSGGVGLRELLAAVERSYERAETCRQNADGAGQQAHFLSVSGVYLDVARHIRKLLAASPAAGGAVGKEKP